MIQAILLAAGSLAILYASVSAFREIRRRARTSVTVQVGDRDYIYTPEMTPDDLARVLAKDFNERPTNGRRKEAVHS